MSHSPLQLPPPTIADHGLIGNCRTAALVSSRGSINWLCAPHFDSPAVFARLLDAEIGGSWDLHPEAAFRSHHTYVEGTNILCTTFTTDHGRVQCLDLMDLHAPLDGGPLLPGALFRIVEGLEGEVDMITQCTPRPHYATVRPPLAFDGEEVRCGDLALRGAVAWEHVPADHAARARFTLRAGERTSFRLSGPGMDTPVDAAEALARTARFWEQWSARCTYQGPYRAAVLRSVLTLKLLHDHDSGALVAAPTTSLPEEVGGVRNWDYRFCWIRDASLTLHALMAAGYLDEDASFFDWIMRTVKVEGPDIRILYPISAEGSTEEQVLGHLQGYRGSRPVRIGNAAACQLQLDVFGEVLDALHFACTKGRYDPRRIWAAVRPLVDWVVHHWQLPDNGIWEVRGGRRHFVHGKVMCWVALDRAVRLCDRYGLDGDVALWRAERDRIHADVCHRGFSTSLRAFTQSYEDERIDAANLLLPLVGFLPATDPRVLGTIDATLDRLVENGLCYRYLDAPDGIEGGEATFVLCTCWLVQALHRAGRNTEARALFKDLLSKATELGLFAEEIDHTTGEHLGNFPQAFSHIGLITAALSDPGR